ncbi:outer membrane protein assembly factor BamB family protein [Halostella litorea]|uniref:outer membrane protein assembly factor BamB family protein n=1 Tax=Halostella litorea TaxID=2528831 RepID=UPI001386880F|nr:PQQ-binding-like beta-propeller repeat protein [Halostella litorea]
MERDTTDGRTRRRVLETTGALALGGVAGCLGGGGDGSDGANGGSVADLTTVETVGGSGRSASYAGSWAGSSAPSEAWRFQAGGNPGFTAGMMGPAVDDDRGQVYVTYRVQDESKVAALDAGTGEKAWEATVGRESSTRSYADPGYVTLAGDAVLVTYQSQVSAFEAAGGEHRWTTDVWDLRSNYRLGKALAVGGTAVVWYRSALVGLDLASGDEVWRNEDTWLRRHAVDDEYVYTTSKYSEEGAFSLLAHDPGDGNVAREIGVEADDNVFEFTPAGVVGDTCFVHANVTGSSDSVLYAVSLADRTATGTGTIADMAYDETAVFADGETAYAYGTNDGTEIRAYDGTSMERTGSVGVGGTTVPRQSDGASRHAVTDDAVLFGHGKTLKAWSRDLGSGGWELTPSDVVVGTVVPAGGMLFVVTRSADQYGGSGSPASLVAYE